MKAYPRTALPIPKPAGHFYTLQYYQWGNFLPNGRNQL